MAPVPIGGEAGWVPEPVWTRWWKEKFVTPTGTRSPDLPARNVALYHWAIPVQVVRCAPMKLLRMCATFITNTIGSSTHCGRQRFNISGAVPYMLRKIEIWRTPWIRILPKRIKYFSWSRKYSLFIQLEDSLLLSQDSVTGQTNPPHICTPYFFKTHFNAECPRIMLHRFLYIHNLLQRVNVRNKAGVAQSV
jgi:hypothetical protein